MPEETNKSALQMAEEKAIALTEEYKPKGVYKVHPIVFHDEQSGEDIVGFVKEPSRAAKMAVLDKSVMGAYGAVEEILPTVLIKEHSDPRMYSEDQANDSIYMGTIMAIYKLISFKVNVAKKK